jgi:hypothetical protein
MRPVLAAMVLFVDPFALVKRDEDHGCREQGVAESVSIPRSTQPLQLAELNQ